jgi:hypothetical protein
VVHVHDIMVWYDVIASESYSSSRYASYSSDRPPEPTYDPSPSPTYRRGEVATTRTPVETPRDDDDTEVAATPAKKPKKKIVVKVAAVGEYDTIPFLSLSFTFSFILPLSQSYFRGMMGHVDWSLSNRAKSAAPRVAKLASSDAIPQNGAATATAPSVTAATPAYAAAAAQVSSTPLFDMFNVFDNPPPATAGGSSTFNPSFDDDSDDEFDPRAASRYTLTSAIAPFPSLAFQRGP